MNRGGYDSYGPDEVLNRARERDENVGWDRLFRATGTAAESVWLAVSAVLAVAALSLASRAFLALNPLTLGAIIAIVVALIAARVAGWLAAPFANAIFRQLMWGLSAAALFLLLIPVGLSTAELVQLVLVGGNGQGAASLRAFNAFATVLALIVALPVWALYAFCIWLRHRPSPQARPASRWRRGLPIGFVLLMTAAFVHEGVWFASL